MRKNNSGKYAFVILVMSGVLLGFARGGIMNIGGVFLPSVSNELGVQTGTLALYYTVSAVVMMIAMPTVGKLVQKVNVKTLIIVSIILQGGSFAAFGLLSNVIGFYLLAIPMAIGTAIPCHIIGPVLINSWFKKKTGLATGLMMSIATVISIVILSISGSVISSIGWRSSYMIAGLGSALVVVVVTLLFIRFPKKTENPYGHDIDLNSTANVKKEVSGVTLEEAKKSVALYSLIGFMFLLTIVASFTQLFTTMAISRGYTLEEATITVGVMTLGILIGSILFGVLNDKLGAKKSVLISLSSGLTSSFLILFVDNEAVYNLSMILFGFMVSSLATMAPLLVKAIFGEREYAKIYSMVVMGLALGGMIGTPLLGFIAGPSNDFDTVLIVVIVLIITSVMSILTAFKKQATLHKSSVSLQN